MYGIQFLRTHRSYTVQQRVCVEFIAGTALKARVRSRSTRVLQHSQQGFGTVAAKFRPSFETVAAKLRPSSKLRLHPKVQVRSQLRALEAATLLVTS